jgi:polar amino acid transport system permease protein
MYRFDFSVLVPYWANLLAGLGVTLGLTLGALGLGASLGLPLALARMARSWWLSVPAAAYIEFFRTTPPLVQIVWTYFVLPVVIGIEIGPFVAAVLALGCNMAAFMAEIYRAGFQAIDPGQRDAARVLGLSGVQTFHLIILPQGIKIVLPPIGAMTMLLLKSTSLAAAIAVLELTHRGQLVALATFRPFEVLTVVALMYFAVTYPITFLVRALERRFGAADRIETGKMAASTGP